MPSQSDLFELFDQDMRRRLLNYLSKRISYRKLGISSSYLYMLRTGKRRITDSILEKLLREISVYELFSLVWWGRWDLNPRPSPPEGDVLPGWTTAPCFT